MQVLINSYACCPNMGSEPGMGWNWIVSLALYCDCLVISEGEFRPQVDRWLAQPENNTIASHLHFYWLPIGGQDIAKCERIRQMCRHQGDWRFYYYYRKWQKRAADCARELIEAQAKSGNPIQIMHHLNMIGFREPGYLWKVSREVNLPLIWGPINAKDGYPMAYTRTAPFKLRLFLHLKNTITRIQLKWSPRVRCMADISSAVIAASSDAQQSIDKYWHKTSICINETGCPIPLGKGAINESANSSLKEQFDILWCGRLYFGKHLELALRAIVKTGIPNAVLHVVGGGDDEPYRMLANRIGANVVWHGQVSHDKVQELMQSMDLLLFTSVFEGTPHVVLEAIANRLPVVCHRTCGQGDVVNDKVGITCPVITPEQSVSDFAKAIRYLYLRPDVLSEMRDNCVLRAKELSWDNKAQQMINIYKQVLKL